VRLLIENEWAAAQRANVADDFNKTQQLLYQLGAS
jgi:hypothetical protein